MLLHRPGPKSQPEGGLPIDIATLAQRFAAIRAEPADLDAAFAQALALAVGGESADGDPRLFALRRAGVALAAEIRINPGRTAVLPCHNHHHFAEAVLAMGALCATARKLGLISTAEAALGIVAMVGHDIDHDGVALVPGALEAHSAARTAAICRDVGVGEADCALISDIIIGTSPALVSENAGRASGQLPAGRFGPVGDRLCAMANEADVFASLLPVSGIGFGWALAEEMRQAGHPAAETIGTFRGRLSFLRLYAAFSPAATALGLPGIVQAQLNAFSTLARDLHGGDQPEDGAELLDRMQPDAARDRFLLAFAAERATPRARDISDFNPVRALKRFQVSLTVTILTAFSVVFITVMGSTALATYRVTMEAVITAGAQAMTQLTELTAARTSALVQPLYAVVGAAPSLPDVTDPSTATLSDTEQSFRNLLGILPQVRSISAIRPDGAWLQMIDLGGMSAKLKRQLNPPEAAKLAVQIAPPVGAGEALVKWRFLDAAGHLLAQRQGEVGDDLRLGLEYRTALNSEGVATTVLHIFPALGVPGISIVRQMPQGGVLGIDVALDSLSDFLAAQRVTHRSSAMIIDDNGILIAHSDRSLSMTSGDQGSWTTIASAKDPLLHAIWLSFATGALAPGRDIILPVGGDPIPGDDSGRRTYQEDYRVRMAALRDVGSPSSLVVVAVPMIDFTAPVDRARFRTLLLFALAGTVGLAMITFVAHTITKPLAALTGEADAIRRFDLDHPMTVSSHIAEVSGLASTMDAMKSALQTFGLYVPKDLVRQLVSGNRRARLGGERREVTVMFTDIVSFTTIADGMAAELLMRLTSEYFERMTRAVMSAGGTIDKYIGDAIMALWNAPSRDLAHATNGCLAALRCRALSDAMAVEFAERGWPPLRTRFGLNTGEAVIGNVGSSDRMSYTAISATVNQAARLEGLNKQYGSQILVGAATRAHAGEDFVFRHVDCVLPKGQRTPANIHELLGLRRAANPQDQALVLSQADIAWAESWDVIVKTYLERRFDEALALLRAANAGRSDQLGGVFEARLAALIADPPPDGWDGVISFHEK